MAAYTRDEKWRPRRGKPDYRNRQTVTGRISSDSAFVLKDLEERVATLSVDSAGYASELVRLRHVKPVASYSWIDAPVPTIVVPGKSKHAYRHIPHIYVSIRLPLDLGGRVWTGGTSAARRGDPADPW